MKLVTVIGGAGVFGGRVAREAAGRADVRLRIVGRGDSGRRVAADLGAEFVAADATDARAVGAAVAGSTVVVHAAGPFQGRNYTVARACLDAGAHYLDLADDRGFVRGIAALDEAARRAGVVVLSGASTVPALSSALVAEIAGDFAAIDSIDVFLSPGGRNPRGAATIASVLSYVGRPIPATVGGRTATRIGWGDARSFDFPPPMNRRRVHSCDAPDTAIFPTLFGAAAVRFFAGLEVNLLNYGLSALAAVRRVVALRGLERFADTMLRLSGPFAAAGTGAGGVAVCVAGTDRAGRRVRRRAALFTETDSAAIAAGPAVVLAERLLASAAPAGDAGAGPCVGRVTVAEVRRRMGPALRSASDRGRGWEGAPGG